MPELPEVQTTVDGLNKKVLGRTFVDVWSDWEKIIKKPKNFKEFKKNVKGKKITKIYRRAKNIIIDLSGGYSILVHMKMTGHLLVSHWLKKANKWEPKDKESLFNDPYNKFLHVVFFLDNKEMMALSDVRKFAKIELWKTKELLIDKGFTALGPEPLEESFTLGQFKEIMKKKKGKVKQVIMIPEVIAGIGNIYASEALWEAKIHPEKHTSKLTDKELKLLFYAIKKVLRLGVRLGGESFSDYRKVDGSKGNFGLERKAYKREGQECQRCKIKLKRIHFGGRSAFFCPKCQKV